MFSDPKPAILTALSMGINWINFGSIDIDVDVVGLIISLLVELLVIIIVPLWMSSVLIKEYMKKMEQVSEVPK